MTHEEYENAKKELGEKLWKLENLTGSDSFKQHMKMHVEFLQSVISKYEDCHHINKSVVQHIEISIEVLE